MCVQFIGYPSLSRWASNRFQNVSLSTARPHSGNKSVFITHDGVSWGTAITHRFATPLNRKNAVWIFDDMSSPSGFVFFSIGDANQTDGVSVGIYPEKSQSNYTYCPSINTNGCMDTGIKRTLGWHQFKLIVSPKGSYGKIDATSLSYLPANTINSAVNTNLTQFQIIGMGIISDVSTPGFYFDDLTTGDFIPASSSEEIAMQFVDMYLSSYGNVTVQNVNQLIKARESEFCSVDYWPPTNICPSDGSQKRPHWIYNEWLFGTYGGLLDKAYAHVVNYLKRGQTTDLDKAKEIISYVDGENTRWKQNKSGSAIASLLAVSSWYVWDKLDPALQQSITNHLVSDAEYFKNQYQPYSEYIGNSSGEENLWPAGYLTNMAIVFKGRPEAQDWLVKAKFFAFHTLTRGETYGGFTSRTIYDDYLFDNHDFHPNPDYGMTTPVYLTALAYMSNKYLGSVPSEFKHNALPVWNAMINYIDVRNFQYKGCKLIRQKRDSEPTTPIGNPFCPAGKDDWGGDATSLINYEFMKRVYSFNTYTDPETGFSTNDLARHAAEYIYYIKGDYLWKPANSNIIFTEMLWADDQNSESYKWHQNSFVVSEAISYLINFDSTIPLPPPHFINDISALRSILSQFTSIFDYNLVVGNYGSP